eukprot:TRINITY_DN32079_c0_g2_i1.p1 TRINITY_DN32079_c0_g2~~TRINITY_DN32079_c0_g2_i1.p1  ORF type:complete len:292 (-),score=51.67 TRINITY_DN32079_c0_g2_i1:671-1546(-)
MDASRANGDEFRRGLKSFLAGALGGATDSLFTMPFDTVKTQMQISKQAHPTMGGCVSVIYRADGVPGFYRGYTPFLVMAAGKAGVRWGFYRLLYDAVYLTGHDPDDNKAWWTFACGTGAGVGEALVWTAPAERLKVLRQKAAGTGIRSTAYGQILRGHGLSGLWVGATPTAMRSASNAAVRFSVASHVREFYRSLTGTAEGHKLPFVANFLAGGTGGAISVLCNNPIDVVKTRMQAGTSTGVVACFRALYAEGGVMAFSAGLSARVPQIFLSQAIQFAVIDKVAGLLDRVI